MPHKTVRSSFKMKQFFLLLLIAGSLTGFTPPDPAGLQVKQRGTVLYLSFPALKNRSALKVTTPEGILVAGRLVDENSCTAEVPLSKYQKGVHVISLQNRIQRFVAQVMLY
jgi:hypothetical protein